MTTTTFDWTLPKTVKTTIYDKKKCVEDFDMSRLYSFIKAEMGISYLGNSRYDNVSQTFPTELEQMKAYKQKRDKNKTNIFHTAFHLPRHKWGRVTPAGNLSLSIFHRPTRHAFCDEYYIDLDMVNAQPSILYEICKHHGISNSYLEKYINSPKECRTQIMEHHGCNKDTAKQLPITLMMGGSYNGWLKDTGLTMNENNKISQFVEIENFMKTIIETIYKANPDIQKDVLKQDPKRWPTMHEKKRGVMGLWCQTVERMVQEECISYLVEKKIIVLEETVPCQDGFMIKKDTYYADICEDLNICIKEKYNINIGWALKEFDEKVEIPAYKITHSVVKWNDLLSAKMLGNRFLESFGDYVVRTAQNRVYVYWGNKIVNGKVENGRWYDETTKCDRYKLYLYISEELFKIVQTEISSSVELKEEEIDKLLSTLRYNTSTSHIIDNIIKHIISSLSKLVEKAIPEFDRKPFLLGFENGVWDLNANCFRPYEFDDYMTISTKYDYAKIDYAIPEMVFLREQLIKIVEDIHEDEERRLLCLQILASGLDGRLYQKLFLFNGQGGNGKGLIASLMKAILGDYCHTPNNGLLREDQKANAPSPDIMNLKNKRYINFQEVEGTIKGSVLKKYTGGGTLTGRLLQCNPEEFYPSATYVMEFNVAPDLDGKVGEAEARRVHDIYFTTNFVEKGSNKIGTTEGDIRYKEGNTYFETPEFVSKMRPIFLDMLLGVYETYRNKSQNTGIQFDVPQSVKDRSKKFLENQNLFLKIFNNHYVRTADMVKKIPVKHLWDTISSDDEHKRVPHAIRKNYGRDEFYKWCREYLKASDNTAGKVLTVKGVELKEQDQGNGYMSDADTDIL